ncbi:MAG: alpha/beta fold hydrolase [Rhodospirillaceae bacterium]
MPIANVRGVTLNYEVHGNAGPWMTLTPGGRRALDSVRSLAQRMAAAGYRVLIHDRRNCGASDVSIDGREPEYQLWADDLHALLGQLGGLPAIVGGSSSGCRTSILMALRHPEAVRALLLWRVTGGAFAAKRLAENYYGQFIAAAKQGGMAAVCEMEHFRDRINERPSNRDVLMKMAPAAFIDEMTKWSRYFLEGADLPVIGATAAELGSIKVPTLVVPGNDRTHGLAVGHAAHKMIPGSELFELFTADVDTDLVPMEDWDAREDEMAAAFVDFLRRRLPKQAA